jgi:four helix bundle protein
MNIAKKEARESLYWRKLLSEFEFMDKQKMDECIALVNILTSIVKISSSTTIHNL